MVSNWQVVVYLRLSLVEVLRHRAPNRIGTGDRPRGGVGLRASESGFDFRAAEPGRRFVAGERARGVLPEILFGVPGVVRDSAAGHKLGRRMDVGRNAVDMVDREPHGILEILFREVAR